MAASTEALDCHRITPIRDKFTEGRHALEAQHGTPHGCEEIIAPPGGIRAARISWQVYVPCRRVRRVWDE